MSDQSIEITAATTVHVASLPWAFTQHQPMGTDEFIKAAERRGVRLDLPTLQELYRQGLLVPFLYVSDRRVGPSPGPIGGEPAHPGGTLLQRLRHGRERGRLVDLAAAPYRPRLRFDLPAGRDRRRWWNGFLYSHYQLLVLSEIGDLLNRPRYRLKDGRRVVRLPTVHPTRVDQAARLRTMASALTALEARYFPALDPEWVKLSNAEPEEWLRYRAGFDPVAMSARLGYSAAQARQDAEWLLLRAHRLDPVGGSWSQLIWRAPSGAWEGLKDAALQAMDDRIAAEILLRFYEDLVDQGQADPLPDLSAMNGWHPLHERLSYRRRTLDENLMDLGVSPHPRVVLAVEGHTEQIHVPLIWRELEYPDAPELMRVLMLEGVSHDLKKVAALAAAPLVGERAPSQQPAWLLIKPPTRLFIATDPEGPYADDQVQQTKAGILGEIKAVLEAQGVERPNPDELAELVEIRTWSASCYEFAHFTDDELADGIMAVHHTIGGLTRAELLDALAYWRGRGDDIKRLWRSGWDPQQRRPTGRQWEYEVNKRDLARALWPTLKAKIDLCRADPDAPIPEIVEVVQDTYHLAQRWRHPSFVLSEAPVEPEQSE